MGSRLCALIQPHVCAADDLIEDAMIAAIAQVHGLVVVTRNVRDFDGIVVRVLDPFGFVP
jgi:toxin FitB